MKIATIILASLVHFYGYSQENDTGIKPLSKLNITDTEEAYQNNRFLKLNTSHPEVGKKIDFIYSGVFAETLTPHLTLYFEKSGRLEWKTLQTNRTAKGVEGSFILPDSVSAFSIKARNNLKDTIEAFTYNVYENGRLKKGSLGAAAKFYFKYRHFNGINSPEIAQKLLKKEFEINPSFRNNNLLLYFETGIFDVTSPVRPLVKKTWKDSLKFGRSEHFLTDLYRLTLKFSKFDEKKSYLEELLHRYPTGAVAAEVAKARLKKDLGKADFFARLRELELKFSKQLQLGVFDDIYEAACNYLINNSNTSDFEQISSKIKSKVVLKKVYVKAVSVLLDKNVSLPKAKEYMERALKLKGYEDQYLSRHIFNQKEWYETLEVIEGKNLALYAQVIAKLGNGKEAIEILKSSLKINNFDPSIKEYLLKFLTDQNEYQQVLELGTSFIVNDQETDSIKSYHRRAYEKIYGKAEKYNDYYGSLIDSINRNYKLDPRWRMNVKSPNLKFLDFNGKFVSLDTFKGRAVVLYFFRTINSRTNEQLINLSFDKIAAKFKLDSGIVFFGVDVTVIPGENSEINRSKRIEEVKNFIDLHGLKFKIFIDKFRYDPNTSMNWRFEVAEKLSSAYYGQFYIIDQDRFIRYRSNPGVDPKPERFERELQAALEIVKF